MSGYTLQASVSERGVKMDEDSVLVRFGEDLSLARGHFEG